MLDTVEKALNEVVGFIDMGIELTRLLAVRSWRNHGFGLLVVDRLDQRARIIGLVGDDFLGLNAIKQRLDLGDIVGLSGGECPAR